MGDCPDTMNRGTASVFFSVYLMRHGEICSA